MLRTTESRRRASVAIRGPPRTIVDRSITVCMQGIVIITPCGGCWFVGDAGGDYVCVDTAS